MNRVVGRMEKPGILESVEQWRAMRLLRNLGAHEYDPSEAGRVRFINALAAVAPSLLGIAENARRYARGRLLRSPCGRARARPPNNATLLLRPRIS
jgi:hypothetical protein